jgi:hypothetical protein
MATEGFQTFVFGYGGKGPTKITEDSYWSKEAINHLLRK